jgi:ABC-2 type transport system permease protein
VTQTAVRPYVAPDAAPTGGKHRLHEPGGRGGLLEVIRSRSVVTMLVRRDLRLKYRYSSIGYLWEYVSPTIHFLVYYFIIGVVLGLSRRVENFAVYVFSGLCIVHFFTQTLNSSAKSIIKNRSIVKKVWLPREIFPIVGVMVAMWRFVALFIILMVGATMTGWYFTWSGLVAAVAGFTIVVLWGIAWGLLLSIWNVYVREVGNMLQIVGFLTHWLVPMIKPWSMVQERLSGLGTAGTVIMALYVYNPLCTAVELFHLAFWSPTVDYYLELSPNLWTRAWVMIVVGIGALMFAQWMFRRLQFRVVDEL